MTIRIFLICVGFAILVGAYGSFMHANPCLTHGGSGTWPWYAIRQPGVVICADNTTWRVWSPPNQTGQQ
jgi:hypothetical protein